MAYSELIKNFERIRDYMRQFYVYGFKSRDEYNAKSSRSYDNERRRIESWLSDYMSFRQDSDGKKVFLSVDSRTIPHNPLYSAFKAKSFTDGDITFHFYILDLLHERSKCSVKEIVEYFNNRYSSFFNNAKYVEESTIRKKLREYESLGILKSEKRGRELTFSRTEDTVDQNIWREAVSFFAEENPLGVIGSYILDKYENIPDHFRFKHHYILHALDSQILCELLLAIDDKYSIELGIKGQREQVYTVYPYKIYISTQSGRQYVLCYNYELNHPVFFRLDNIRSVKSASAEPSSDKYDAYCESFRKNLWGVSVGKGSSSEHVEILIHVDNNESFIIDRLKREKRCGQVEIVNEHTFRFSADVCDAAEMLPWIRTFTGRILDFKCTNPDVTKTFWSDLDEMFKLYGGDTNAV